MHKISEVEQSLAWARALTETLRTQKTAGIVDPITYNIVLKINRWHWLEACIQALTRVRYSDLKQIELEPLLAGAVIRIKEQKTGKYRYLSDLYLLERTNRSHLEANAIIAHANYDSYATALKKVIPGEVKSELKNSASSTHVFRHLKASWMYSRGCTVDEIQEYFLHESKKTTLEYIHSNLFTNKTIII